jgi:hypothetical protein
MGVMAFLGLDGRPVMITVQFHGCPAGIAVSNDARPLGVFSAAGCATLPTHRGLLVGWMLGCLDARCAGREGCVRWQRHWPGALDGHDIYMYIIYHIHVRCTDGACSPASANEQCAPSRLSGGGR